MIDIRLFALLFCCAWSLHQHYVNAQSKPAPQVEITTAKAGLNFDFEAQEEVVNNLDIPLPRPTRFEIALRTIFSPFLYDDSPLIKVLLFGKKLSEQAYTWWQSARQKMTSWYARMIVYARLTKKYVAERLRLSKQTVPIK